MLQMFLWTRQNRSLSVANVATGEEEICTLIRTLDCLESVRFPFGNIITLNINNMLRAYDRMNGSSKAFFVREEYSILSKMKGNQRH